MLFQRILSESLVAERTMSNIDHNVSCLELRVEKYYKILVFLGITIWNKPVKQQTIKATDSVFSISVNTYRRSWHCHPVICIFIIYKDLPFTSSSFEHQALSCTFFNNAPHQLSHRSLLPHSCCCHPSHISRSTPELSVPVPIWLPWTMHCPSRDWSFLLWLLWQE